MRNKYFLVSALSVLFVMMGCEKDFLERPPKDSLVDANFFKTDGQILSGTGLLYNKVWFDYNKFGTFNLVDYRGGTAYSTWNNRDNVEFRTTAGTVQNGEAWSSLFNVVGQANTLIQNVNRYAGEEVSEAIKQHAIAEARFMRATAYSFLVMNWGPVPIIENNQTLLSDTTIARNTVESVWEFITRDYLFAAEHLPDSPIMEGRITRWSAEGMLARTYLTRAGVGGSPGGRNQEYLNKAMEYAERVITMSGRSLLDNYADLFLFPYDNKEESLFELQWVFNPGDYGTENAMPAQIAYSSVIGNGDGWGNDKAATWWVLSLYDGLMENGYTADERLHATYMLPGARYPEITMTATVDDKEVEQELVLPYVVREDSINWAHIKKYITGKAIDVGGQAASQEYGHNTYMLRLAEMYLIYAEAAIGNSGSTSDGKALEYFNEVHTRAGLSPHKGLLTWDDVFNERIIEFAFEAMSWYDLVRLYYYDPSKAFETISDQDRGEYHIEPNQKVDATSWKFKKIGNNSRTFPANANNFTLPLPATEVSQAPNLRKPAVPYDFGDE